jgi:ring-1,2-phenylacetyl-CoA epoxidase subunit PaaB
MTAPVVEPAVPATPAVAAELRTSVPEWPLFEVFVRARAGLDHKHCGSLHAADAKMAVQLAREVYTRRQEGTSVWVVRSSDITASDPADQGMYFDPMADKIYRHPTFYELPAAVDHM